MFTGLYEYQNYNLTKNIYIYSKKIPILAQILTDLGYSTFFYTENPYLSRQSGLLRGFKYKITNWEFLFKDTYLDKMDRYIRVLLKPGFWFSFWHKIKTILDKIYKKLKWLNWINSRYINPLELIEANLQKYLLKIKTKPFFLFFNLMATHAPYLNSKKILDTFKISIDEFKIIKNIFLHPMESFLKINFNSDRLSDEEIAVLEKIYNASVLYCDWIVKNLILKLKNLGMLENTYVIITSDHGELLGGPDDHYYWTHGVFHGVYESLLKVPLIIYNPNLEGTKIEKQVELKDIFHTILHLTGISKEDNEYLDINKSFIQQINANTTPKYIFGEFFKDKKEMLDRVNLHKRNLDEALIPKLLHDIYFLRSQNYKLISYGNKFDEFYDISKDPYEKHNLVQNNTKEYQDMKIFLQKFIRKIKGKEDITKLITKSEEHLIKKAISNITFK